MDTSETYKRLSDDASPLKPDYKIETVKWYADPIYIKMCEKAEKIQKLKYPKPVYLHKSGMGQVCHGFNGDFDWGQPTDEIVEPFVVPMPLAIWLPRQDQLQEMIFGIRQYGARQIVKALWDACRECASLVPRKEIGIPRIGTVDEKWSMEQLWLAFVMKEKYGKVWNGTDWIKGSSENEVTPH